MKSNAHAVSSAKIIASVLGALASVAALSCSAGTSSGSNSASAGGQGCTLAPNCGGCLNACDACLCSGASQANCNSFCNSTSSGGGGSSGGANSNGGSGGSGHPSGGSGGSGNPSGGTGGSSSGAGGSASGAGGASSGAGGTSSGTGGSASGAGGSGLTGGDNSMTPTMLPSAMGMCPQTANLNGTVATFAGQQVTVWSGDPSKGPGPLLIYWYATGSSPSEVTWAIGQPQIAKFTAAGGMIAAQNKTTSQGSNTGDNVWYTGDAPIADEIVACAIQNQHIDPRRIHSAGYSAGALQTVYMWYARSGYIASVMSYSGGIDGINQPTMQDPSNIAPAIAAHGGDGTNGTQDDNFILDFNKQSLAWEMADPNGFIIDCNDGGAHTDTAKRTAIAPQGVQFFFDHPFKVKPEPYANGLPSGWPSDCHIVGKM